MAEPTGRRPTAGPRSVVASPARTDYAGLVSRSIAYVLDALVVGFLVSAAVAVVLVVAAVAGAHARDLAVAAASAYVLFLPAFLTVYCALLWLLAGRTPGMAALGLRVTRADGRPVLWFAALLRALLLVCFPLGALWLLVDRRHQALHDKVARTVVVRSSGPRDRLEGTAWPKHSSGEP